MSCRLDYGSQRHISVDIKVFAITTVDVYKYTPPLIFNAVVEFLNESNHRKCVKRKGMLGLKHMLGFLLSGNKCPNAIAHKLTHTLKFGAKREPGDTVALRAKYKAYVEIWCNHNSRMVQYCFVQHDAGREAK